MISKVKGTQDFLDLTLYNFVVDTVKEHLATYNYTEIATPIIEHVDLFIRSVGEHTDIVNKEMFTLTTKGDEVLCLRPEATASIARAFVNAPEIATPWKVFTVGPMFRYERPQKGRFRQFHQISIEVIGANAVAEDVLFITMLDKLFRKKFLLDNFVLVINYLGCPNDRQRFAEELIKFLNAHDEIICATCKDRKSKNTLRIFDCKNPQCQDLYKEAPKITDCLCTECALEWQQLKEQLDILSVSYVVSPLLVRGLDYYNKTVFEFVSSSLGAQNTFCGGGRYDQLIKLLGSKEDQPSIGAAMGLERLIDLVTLVRDKLPIKSTKTLTIIVPMSKQQHSLALLIAQDLLNNSIAVEPLFEDASVKSMMRKANKLGAKYVVIIGEEEHKNQTVTLKNMVTGEEKVIAQTQLKAEIS